MNIKRAGPLARPLSRAVFLAVLVTGLSPALRADTNSPVPVSARASTESPGFAAAGALDQERFSLAPASAWKGAAGARSWWWQVEFAQPRKVGAILQVSGDHDFVLRNAPRRYVWQWSQDGTTWQDWKETAVLNEERLFRLHRLSRTRTVRTVRIKIETATGEMPTLRAVEFYHESRAPIAFPDWIVVVNTTHDPKLPGHGQEFIPLARSSAGSEQIVAQQVWLDSFHPAFWEIEPRPLCAFLSGNFKDWCEVDRRLWRGVGEVLQRKKLPIWASCGGAQGLGLLSVYGVDQPWDCPHCRDPFRPKTPLYGHIGHLTNHAGRVCGDYSGCVFERGPFQVQQVGLDPVFQGLPAEIRLMESHCGQLEWVPKGWRLVATAGAGTQTKIQCLRLGTAPIYAAQFHIEMAGTPEASQRIMKNFLQLAKRWKER